MKYIQPNTDMYITLTGLQNPEDDSYYNAATVTAVVQTVSGTEVVSSQSLSYTTDSNGNYTAVLDEALFDSLTRGLSYVILITATQSGRARQFKMIAVYDYDVDP